MADIAEPPNVKQAFDASLSFALLKTQLDKVDSATNLGLVTRNAKGGAETISLTGWVALMGITAMVVLLSYGGWTLYKRVKGIPDKDYTLVVKQTHR